MLELGRPSTFVERAKPGYDRVVGFKKPIVIAELGYEGSDAYVRAWAQEKQTSRRPNFPR